MEWSDNTATHQELGKSYTVMRPAFVIELYGEGDLAPHGEAIFDRVWSLLPRDREYFCINKRGREYKRLDARALARLRKTLTRLADESQFYMLKDAPDFDVVAYSAELALGAPGGRVVVGLPLELLAAQGADALEALVRGFVEDFPFHTGTAGFGFHQVFGIEAEMAGMPMNIRVARRFWGIGVRHRYQEDALHRQLKSAHWLTFVDEPLVAQLGGDAALAKLGPEVAVTRVRGGALLRAGSTPPVGDVNVEAPDIAPMREVNAFIRPIRLDTWVTHNLFRIDPDDAHAWLTRLD
jgi:hypothetical protein